MQKWNWKTEVLAVTVLTLLGFFLRVWKITSIPPGLWLDEAINGLDALSLLHDNPFRIFFQYEQFPREPFYIYCIAPFVALFGNEPWAIRLASVTLGTLTLPLLYLFTREWFDRRTALLALACLVFLRWHVHFSRTGFRTIAAPPFMLLGFWLLHRGLRLGKTRDYVLSGFFFAAGFYTYLALRLVPFVILIWLMGFLLLRKNSLPERFGKNATWLLLAGALTLAPLIVHYIRVPYHFIGRPEMIRIGPPEALENAAKVALMFSFRGDHVGKHNVPRRVIERDGRVFEKKPAPVFDPLTSIFFYLGLLALLLEARRSHAALLALAWLFVMSLNSVLSFGAPNLLRTVALTPVVALILARGYSLLCDWKATRRIAPWLTALCFSAFAAIQTMQYFFAFPASLKVWREFNTPFYEFARFARDNATRGDVYLPGDVLHHATTKFTLYGVEGVRELTLPDALAENETGGATARDRLILVTPHTQLHPQLERLFPAAKIVRIFYTPPGEPFGAVYLLPADALRPAAEIEAYFKDLLDVSVFPNR